MGAFLEHGAVWLVVMEDDNSVTVWDYTHDSLIASLKGATAHRDSTTTRARFDSQGQRLIASVGDHSARIWDLKSGTEISSVAVNPRAAMIYDLGFSQDGKLAYAAADALYVWEVATGKVVSIIRTAPGDDPSTIHTMSASFNPDATEIAAAAYAETRIWDVATGKAKRELTKAWLDIVRYSPDGRRIAVVKDHGETADILDAKTGAIITSLVGHTHFIDTLEYSSDGSLILTTSEDSTARLWNAQTGQQIRVLTDIGGMFRAHFSPDGKTVLTESGGPAFMKLQGNGTEPWRRQSAPPALPDARSARCRIPRSRATGLVHRDGKVALRHARLEGLAQIQTHRRQPAAARHARMEELGFRSQVQVI
jgi:WD40 repeat protein